MIQKILISKNKKKLFGIIISILIIITLVILFIYQKYNYNYFINKIENNTGLEIKHDEDYKINFFPKFYFKQDNIEISKDIENFLFIARQIDLEIIKEYIEWNKTKFIVNSPSATIKGIPLRNISLIGNYKKSNINIDKINSNINDGKITIKGNIKLDEKIYIDLKGNFQNIPIITILNQSKIIDWKRLKIKLRSDFSVKTSGKNNYELLRNLNAKLPIQGMFYINATPEERFGTALLNALAKKLPEIKNISKSLNFIFSKYADIPSEIEGSIIVKEGMAKTNELYIFNESAKIKVDIVYNIIEDKIKGNLFFYEDEKIYLKAELSGNINNPKILVGGKPFIRENGKEPIEDIKKIIEDGITNIFQKLLENTN